MEIKTGQYARFEGLIAKLEEVDKENDYVCFDIEWLDHWCEPTLSMDCLRFIQDYEPIVENNLKNLIIKDDWVNGKKVVDITDKEVILENGDTIKSDEDIEYVITKELISSTAYYR